MIQPLPDLRPADFGRRRVFHQVVDRHAPGREPCFKILNADADVVAKPGFGARPVRRLDEIAADHVHVVAQPVDLIRPRHAGVENGLRDRHEAGMRHPRAVVAFAHFAELVGADFVERARRSRRDRP